jgi:hypothetical protein
MLTLIFQFANAGNESIQKAGSGILVDTELASASKVDS